MSCLHVCTFACTWIIVDPYKDQHFTKTVLYKMITFSEKLVALYAGFYLWLLIFPRTFWYTQNYCMHKSHSSTWGSGEMEFRPFQELLPRHVEITRMIDEEVILERHGDFVSDQFFSSVMFSYLPCVIQLIHAIVVESGAEDLNLISTCCGKS